MKKRLPGENKSLRHKAIACPISGSYLQNFSGKAAHLNSERRECKLNKKSLKDNVCLFSICKDQMCPVLDQNTLTQNGTLHHYQREVLKVQVPQMQNYGRA